MKTIALLITTALVTLTLATAAARAQPAPQVEAPWARPTVEGQAGGGGFLRIVGGPTADRLLSAQTEVARSVELHSMAMDGNIMRMRQVDAIDVPAGQTVELKPGGLHLMFMGLKAPLKAGSSFALTLRFEKAGEQRVDVKVMTQAAAPMHKH
ncbi:MAG: copper chaperone PCu(A)C [Rubrivivax sp.]|nr:copper chaperone PCu(A)C [Rubrivivax sp.]